MKRIYFLITMLVLATAAMSQTTYYWQPGGGGSWATAGSWNTIAVGGGTTRITPAANDILIIDKGTTMTISGVPGQVIGRLRVLSGLVTLTGVAGNQTLTIGDATAAVDFEVAGPATLNVAASIENVVLANNTTATIAGTFINNDEFNVNGTGIVATVTGTLENRNDIANGTASHLVFASGGVHIPAGDVDLPTANWNVNSILRFNNGGTIDVSNVNQTVGRVEVLGNTSVTLIGAGTFTIADAPSVTDLTIASGSNFGIGGTVIVNLGNNSTALVDGTLTVGGGRTFNTNNPGASTIVSATGTLINGGTVTSSVATKLTFATGASRYRHNQGTGTIPLATWNTGSFCEIIGNVGGAMLQLNQAFSNFTWNAAGQSASFSLAGALTNITGNFLVSNTNNRTLTLTGNTAMTMNVGGSWTIGGVTDIANVVIGGGSSNPVVNVGGDLVLQNTGSLLLTNADVTTGITDLNIAGKLTMSGTSRLELSDNDADGNIDLAGNFEMSGGTFDFSSANDITTGNGITTLRLGGNFVKTAGTIATTGSDAQLINGTIVFVKAGTQTFSTNLTASMSNVNYTIENGSTVQLLSPLGLDRDVTANFRGTMNINSGGTLDAGIFQVNPQGSGAGAVSVFNLNAGGKIITNHVGGVIGTVSQANMVSAFSNGADYEFRGASTGNFPTTNNEVRDMIINSSTSGQVNLSKLFRVTRNLTLTAGYVTTTTNSLTVTETGNASTTNGAFVNGPLVKATNTTTAFTFPVGTVSGGLRVAGVTPTSAAASTFTARFFNTNPQAAVANGSVKGSGIAIISACEYWTMTRTGAANAAVKISWAAASNCGPGGYVTQLSSLRVAQHDGAAWQDRGTPTGADIGSIVAAGEITSGPVSTFAATAIFALASSTTSENPLPVMFADVKAFTKNTGVQVEWSNVTERDISYYDVERSTNGIDFYTVNTQSPKSNHDDKASYTHFDANPAAGTNYYRIKVMELHGKVIYSKILKIVIGQTKSSFAIYPNPVVGNQATISLTGVRQGQYMLRIVNSVGQNVYHTTINNAGSGVTQQLELPASIKPGMYTSVVSGDGFQQTMIFVVK